MLYVKAEKCKFYFDFVEYFRYILFPSRLTIASDKIKIIEDWSEPKKIKNMHIFLKFANFYY